MEMQDKTFRQAVEELSKQRFPLSEEEFYERMANFAPLVQQALHDGRSIESVAKAYFPTEGQYQAVTAVFRAALLRTVLDTALNERQINKAAHYELLCFLSEMVEQVQGWEKIDRD